MKRSKHIAASTLPELLVLMILCGIILLGVMDGMHLFGTLAADLAGRITRNGSLYADYERLNVLVTSSDSLVSRDGNLLLYRCAEVSATLSRRDSLLIVRLNGRTDTLFTTLTAWDSVNGSATHPHPGIDSLKISLQTPRDSVIDLAFGRFRLPDPEQQALMLTEEKYRYEDQ